MALPRSDYNSLMNALVTVGPIAISVAAGGAPWMFYHGGVVDKPDDCGFVMDHGVTLVGYGTAKVGLFKKMDYWIVRNSWDDTCTLGAAPDLWLTPEAMRICDPSVVSQLWSANDHSPCFGRLRCVVWCGVPAGARTATSGSGAMEMVRSRVALTSNRSKARRARATTRLSSIVGCAAFSQIRLTQPAWQRHEQCGQGMETRPHMCTCVYALHP